jgi:hypothetical protein
MNASSPSSARSVRNLRRLPRAGLAAAACLVLAAGAADAQAEKPAPSESPSADAPSREALLVGSSSMNDSFGLLIAKDLEKKGFSVKRKGVAASGFSRPDYRDILEISKKLPVSPSTDLAVVYLGVNDAQALWLRPEERKGKQAWVKWEEDGWDDLYEKRARSFFQSLCERGAKKVIVLLPVDVMSPGMQRRLERIRNLQKKAAESATCASPVSTGGDVGNFSVNGQATRAKDGIHMSPKGAQVIWDRVKPQVLKLAGG